METGRPGPRAVGYARHVRAVLLTVPVAAAMAAGGARDARACSCVAAALAHPAADAVDVPRNTVFLWSSLDSGEPFLRRAGTGERVALALEERHYDNYYGPVWLGRPDALLEAGASYEICAVVSGSESCSGFTVGSAVDEETPQLAAPTALHAQRLRNVDGECDARCWGSPSDALIIDHAAASEPGYAVIEVRREKYADLSWSFLRPVDPADQRTQVFNTFCGPSVISLEEGVVYCSRMTALDGAGNQGATTAEMCGEVTTCETARCEAPFDGTCPALAPPDAGPSQPDDSGADAGGCSAAAAGSPGWAALLLAIIFLPLVDIRSIMRRSIHTTIQASLRFFWLPAALLFHTACGSVSHGSADGGGEPGTVEVVLDGTGAGRVVSEPEGIDCPGACSAEFAGGTEVTLTATKDDGSAFAGFAGDCSGLDAACGLTVDGDHAVTALFALSGEKRFAIQSDRFLSAIAVHPSGDLVVAGVELDGSGIYLARLSSADGAAIWEMTYAGVDSPAIAVAPTGAIILAGMYFGTPTFGGEVLPHEGDSYDFFVSQIDPDDGSVAWVDPYGGISQDDARSVAVTPDGRIYLGGPYWSPSLVIGDDTLTNTDQDVSYTSEAWVGALMPGGAPIWAKTFGGADGESLGGVAFDGQGNGVAVGSFGGGVSFGDFFFEATDADGFAVKLRESDGEVIWARQFGAAATDLAQAVAVDPDDNTVVAGVYTNEQSWGGDSHTPVGAKDVFLARYTAGGAHDWSTSLGGNGTEQATDLAIDPDGNLILTGYFDADLDAGGGALENAGGQDVFVVKLNRAGEHAWSYRFGGGMDDYSQAAAADRYGIVYLIGTFQGTADVAGETFETDDTASFLVSYWP